MIRMILAGAFLLSVPAAVLASAPPSGSPQSDMMAPYAEWIRGLTNPKTGQGCCSLSDCRVVDYRVAGDGYEAFIDKSTFPGGPDAWLKVPDYVVVHKANPTGFAVACWASWHKESNGWFCFTPSSAV
jgi:hypothetical protein